VTCECGESAKLDHGEHWTCPGCDRAYDTSRIPRAEYDVIRRAQLRFRALPIALGLVVLALAVLFTLTDRPVNVFILLPLALMAWFLFLRPAHQKRYRRAISELPRWDLRADGG
jgi:Flp pilus assembly protein TadB